ncbi:MAG: hypothetical protein U0641_05755 [Anaerolineae bacterium]
MHVLGDPGVSVRTFNQTLYRFFCTPKWRIQREMNEVPEYVEVTVQPVNFPKQTKTLRYVLAKED